MTAAQSADALARLNVTLRDIVTFFEESNIESESVGQLNGYIDSHQVIEFLSLAESYGLCMAFIDHDQLLERLTKSYGALLDGYVIEKKIINKKLKFLKEDKKSDPEVIARLENALVDVEHRKATVNVSAMRLRAMMSIPRDNFMDASFDAIKYTKENKARIRQLLKEQVKEAALKSRGIVHN